MRRLTSLALLAAGLATAAGCGDNGPKPVPVEGRVTLNGKPVKQMLVNFQPVGKTYGTGANGMTDDDGKFSMMDSRGGTGAHVGEYKVSFYPPLNRRVEGDPSTDVIDDGSKSGLPRIYLDGEKTPLRVTVPEGGGTAEIILTPTGKGATVNFQPRGK